MVAKKILQENRDNKDNIDSNPYYSSSQDRVRGRGTQCAPRGVRRPTLARPARRRAGRPAPLPADARGPANRRREYPDRPEGESSREMEHTLTGVLDLAMLMGVYVAPRAAWRNAPRRAAQRALSTRAGYGAPCSRTPAPIPYTRTSRLAPSPRARSTGPHAHCGTASAVANAVPARASVSRTTRYVRWAAHTRGRGGVWRTDAAY